MKFIVVVFLFLLSFGISSAQIITTFAGNGTSSGVSGDGGPATDAPINGANGGAFDKQGNYYVCDILGHRVRKVRPDGIIATIAGTGTSGYNGDGIIATNAQLSSPSSVALDASGNIYIGDGGNYRIRKVDVITGNISTVAGTGTSGFNGDNILATNAQLGGTNDICLDKDGNLYIVDQGNLRIRKTNTDAQISTIAGNGGFSATGTGDGGNATNATFNFIYGLAVDGMGNIYIADYNAAKVRKVNTSNIIVTIAGNGSYTYTGDGVPAINAQIAPVRLTFDRTNNLVIADKYNRRVFRIDNFGIIHSIAGNGASGFSGDNGPATAASLDFPSGIVFDTCNNLYIGESTNRRVRKVDFNPTCEPVTSVNSVKAIDAHFTIYPNPSSSTLTLESPEEIKSVTITNSIGRLIYTRQYTHHQKVEINIEHLPPGLYTHA